MQQLVGGRKNSEVVDDCEHKHISSLARTIAAAASGGDSAVAKSGGGARAAAAGGIEDNGVSRGGFIGGVGRCCACFD